MNLMDKDIDVMMKDVDKNSMLKLYVFSRGQWFKYYVKLVYSCGEFFVFFIWFRIKCEFNWLYNVLN